MAEESPNRFRDLTNAILEAINKRVNGEPIPQSPQPEPQEEYEATPTAASPIDQLNEAIQGAINERVKGAEPPKTDFMVYENNIGFGFVDINGDTLAFVGEAVYTGIEDGRETYEPGRLFPLFFDGNTIPGDIPILNGTNELTSYTKGLVDTIGGMPKDEWPLTETDMTHGAIVVSTSLSKSFGREAWAIQDSLLSRIAEQTRDKAIVNSMNRANQKSSFVAADLDMVSWDNMTTWDKDKEVEKNILFFTSRDGKVKSGLINLDVEARNIGMSVAELKESLKSFMVVNYEQFLSASRVVDLFFNAPRPENPKLEGYYWIDEPHKEFWLEGLDLEHGEVHTLVDDKGMDSARIFMTRQEDDTYTVSVAAVATKNIAYGPVGGLPEDQVNELHKLVEDMAAEPLANRIPLFQERMPGIAGVEEITAEEAIRNRDRPLTPLTMDGPDLT